MSSQIYNFLHAFKIGLTLLRCIPFVCCFLHTIIVFSAHIIYLAAVHFIICSKP